MEIADKQQETFNNIVNVKYKIQGLAAFVQNDFKDLLDESIITDEELRSTIKDMDEQYDAVIMELNKLRDQSRDIMLHYTIDR